MQALKQIASKCTNLLANNAGSSSSAATARMLSRFTSSSSSSSEEELDVYPRPQPQQQQKQASFGLVFDIDGVLVRGKTLLPNTRKCFEMLVDAETGRFRVPTVFLTNAGNELRRSKSLKLSSLLGVDIRPDQVIMSHSPLKMLDTFFDKRCLIAGQGPITQIAKNIGFNNVITIDDLRFYHPHLDVVDHKRRIFSVRPVSVCFQNISGCYN